MFLLSLKLAPPTPLPTPHLTLPPPFSTYSFFSLCGYSTWMGDGDKFKDNKRARYILLSFSCSMFMADLQGKMLRKKLLLLLTHLPHQHPVMQKRTQLKKGNQTETEEKN